MPLNKAQQQAVCHGPGPAMVVAGPGSGKTMVITHRLKHLIREQGADPSRILVVTFTRSAAEEMEERFLHLMGGETFPVTFGTFHSVFFRILRSAYHYSSASIIQADRRMALAREALAQTEWIPEEEEERELLDSILSEISLVKGEKLDISSYYSQSCPDEVFRQVFASYENSLKQGGLLDFDDMIGLVYDLFTARPDILDAWQKKYQIILVDEFQDINRLQYAILQMLAKPQDNLFVVGDDDQSIYRFRGARPEIMIGFFRDYPDAKRIVLDVNYRSVPDVVAAAGRVIRQNRTRFEKKISAWHQGKEPVRLEVFKDVSEEGDGIIRHILRYHTAGIPYEEMAILSRTGLGARAMAEQLIRLNLPFQMEDLVPNLYEHWIAKDILTYLLMGAGSRKRGDFLRIINRPKRYISRDMLTSEEISLDSLKSAAAGKYWVLEKVEMLEYELRMLSKMRPWAGINYIRKGIGYEEFLKEYAEYRHAGFEELLGVLDELQESARPFATLGAWLEHIAEYSRTLQEQKNSRRSRQEKNGIQIRTMHGAKGLEYRVVFILDVNEGNIPHRKAVQPEDLEEERRLFYVAMTRARQYLHICYVKERYHRPQAPSRFVQETGVTPEKA